MNRVLGDRVIGTSDGYDLSFTEVTGDLFVRRADAVFPNLKWVGGAIYVQAAGVSFPVLEAVGRLEDAHGADFPALRTADRFGDISTDTKLPVLETISGYPLPNPDAVAALLRQVASEALKDDHSLNMHDWHTCDTVHCLSGWAVHLSGQKGYELEGQVGSFTAGVLLLGLEAATYFYSTGEKARDWLQMKTED